MTVEIAGLVVFVAVVCGFGGYIIGYYEGRTDRNFSTPCAIDTPARRAGGGDG